VKSCDFLNKVLAILSVLFMSIDCAYSQNDAPEYVIQDANTVIKTPIHHVIAKKEIKFVKGFHYLPTSGSGNYLHARLGSMYYPSEEIKYVPIVESATINSRPNLNLPVGSIDGNFSVSLSGSATYNIPINIPQGTNGIQPNISLAYSSQGKNGIAGMGWNLIGFSAITRTGTNKYQDGVIDRFHFVNTDKLQLDGNRLVLVPGTSGEGSAGAVYATENGNLIRIYPQEPTASGYTWFKVIDKDGRIIEYGRSINSRLAIKNGTVSWNISKVIDPNGNYIEYEYGYNDGETFLRAIHYTGNEKAGLIPYASVEFEYKIRSDKNLVYLDGCALKQTLLLDRIVTKYGTDVVNSYNLEYSFNGVSSQLSGIKTLHEGKDQICNSTVFQYAVADKAPTAIEVSSTTIPELQGVTKKQYFRNIIQLFGDFNGDNISDKLVIKCLDEKANKADWFLQYGKYIGNTPNNQAIDAYNNTSSTYQFTTDGPFLGRGRVLLDRVVITDINDDGNDEIIVPRYFSRRNKDLEGKNRTVFYDSLFIDVYMVESGMLKLEKSILANFDRMNNSAGTIDENDKIFVNDFDGDGYKEILLFNTRFDIYDGGFWDPYNFYYGKEHYHRFYLANIVEKNSSGALVLKNDIKFECIKQSKEYASASSVNAQVFVINYDNNAKADVLFISDQPGEKGVFELDPATNRFTQRMIDADFEPNFCYYLADFNGDGLTDVLNYRRTARTNRGWFVKYGMGGKFHENETIPELDFGPPMGDDRDRKIETFANFPICIDFDLDGKTDILWYSQETMDNCNYEFLLSKGNNEYFKQKFTFSDKKWLLGLQQAYEYVNECLYYIPPQFIDINGDHKLEIYNQDCPICNNSNQIVHRIISFDLNSKSNLLENIYDGFNNNISIDYKNLSAGSPIYGKKNDNNCNILNLGGGMEVVSSFKNKMANTQNSNSIEYSYVNARVHLGGKGFLGF
jgi:hypothetical protein